MDPSLEMVFSEGNITTPTLHVLGDNDFIVTEARALTLIQVCDNPRVERHPGGSYCPPSTRRTALTKLSSLQGISCLRLHLGGTSSATT